MTKQLALGKRSIGAMKDFAGSRSRPPSRYFTPIFVDGADDLARSISLERSYVI